jgi:CheY-like chemotaxis protein
LVSCRNYAEGPPDPKDFDLIFSDILLGGRTGIDVLREARERNLVCPIVMITGHPTAETAAEAVRLGAFDYLPKPVEQDALLHIARLALAHKNVLAEKERYRAHLDAFSGVRTAYDQWTEVQIARDERRPGTAFPGWIGRNQPSSMCCKERLSEALKETVEEKKSVRIERFECAHDERAVKILTVSTYPLIDRQGVFTGAVAVLRTSRLAFEEDLESAAGSITSSA